MPNIKEKFDQLGNILVRGFQVVALFLIGATIAWSAGHDYLEMMQRGHAKLDDILLLFIYLELGTIIGIYFRTDRLPVLFLLYVAITAMTRFLAIDVKDLSTDRVVVVTASIFLLTLAVLAVQIGASKFGTTAAERPPRLPTDVGTEKPL